MQNIPNHQHIIISFITLFLTLPFTFALEVGSYSESCPCAETIVRQVVEQRYAADKSVAPALLRMHFHDCFVRGCDASLLIDSTNTTQAEKDATPNLTIREFTLIDEIKSKLETTCPGIVSCADIIALATRDAVALAGGPKYNVPTGRRDGLISRINEVNLPGPAFTVSQAQQSFNARGLNLNDMVVLLGAHTVGVANCNFFQNRLTNFQASGGPDPTMDKALVTKLKGVCISGNSTAFLDQNTSFVFDNEFYKQIMNNKGVMKIDQELPLDPLSSKLVTNLAADNAFFGRRFAIAIIKMGKIQVVEGHNGEIRQNCRVFNKNIVEKSCHHAAVP